MNHVKCERWHLEARCAERGYTVAEVMPCVVSETGDDIVVDVDHPAYPAHSRIPQPGTALKKLLAGWPLRITTDPNCACLNRSAEMDRNERTTPGWCDENTATIVGWLRDEARKRGLPFLDVGGTMLVRRAVSIARREARRVTQAQEATAAKETAGGDSSP
jgi:hypothetical protein